MELFKNTNFDFLGKKWPFIIASLVSDGGRAGQSGGEGRPEVRHRFQGRRAGLREVRVRTAAAGTNPHGRWAKIPGEMFRVQQVRGTNEVMVGTEIQDEKKLNAHPPDD